MKKKIIISLIIIVWVVGCMIAIPSMLAMRRNTKNCAPHFDRLKNEAVTYMEQQLPQSEANGWKVQSLSAGHVDRDIWQANKGRNGEEYVYPYGTTNIYLTNGEIDVVVVFVKDQTGQLRITGFEETKK